MINNQAIKERYLNHKEKPQIAKKISICGFLIFKNVRILSS